MSEPDSMGARAMRDLAGRLQDYADAEVNPTRQHDFKMASSLIAHLERLTLKLAKPAEVPLGSGRRL